MTKSHLVVWHVIGIQMMNEELARRSGMALLQLIIRACTPRYFGYDELCWK